MSERPTWNHYFMTITRQVAERSTCNRAKVGAVIVREKNILATAFHPELAGETRFHRLVAAMASEHDDPGEGAGRRPHPIRRTNAANG